MAKVSAVQKNIKRKALSTKYENRRDKLKKIIRDQSSSDGSKFNAALKLAELPRNSSRTRIRNRCAVTGRPRGYYRKFDMSRIALRELALKGVLPGISKASW